MVKALQSPKVKPMVESVLGKNFFYLFRRVDQDHTKQLDFEEFCVWVDLVRQRDAKIEDEQIQKLDAMVEPEVKQAVKESIQPPAEQPKKSHNLNDNGFRLRYFHHATSVK